MKLAGIFQGLQHLYDFQTISYGGHFVFQNEAKILQVFIGEDIFINEWDSKVYAKTWQMDGSWHARPQVGDNQENGN